MKFVSTIVQRKKKKISNINYTKKYSAQGVSPNQFSYKVKTKHRKALR